MSIRVRTRSASLEVAHLRWAGGGGSRAGKWLAGPCSYSILGIRSDLGVCLVQIFHSPSSGHPWSFRTSCCRSLMYVSLTSRRSHLCLFSLCPAIIVNCVLVALVAWGRIT